MNIQKMLKQAQKMQEQMQNTQAELAQKTVEASIANGKITVTANGAGDILGIKIAREVVDPEDVEMLEDLVLTGVKQAIEKAKALAADEMGKITGGLGLPGMGF
ncbi:MAG: YbaB/EbfC family nucleoid-associated protein [Verrucomicrobiales bacterium]